MYFGTDGNDFGCRGKDNRVIINNFPEIILPSLTAYFESAQMDHHFIFNNDNNSSLFFFLFFIFTLASSSLLDLFCQEPFIFILFFTIDLDLFLSFGSIVSCSGSNVEGFQRNGYRVFICGLLQENGFQAQHG